MRLAAWIGLPIIACLAVSGFGASPQSEGLRARVAGETLREALPPIGASVGRKVRCGPNAADRRLFIFADGEKLDTLAARLRGFVPVPPGKALWYRSGSVWVFDEDLASGQARRRAVLKRLTSDAKQRRQRLAEMGEWLKDRPGEPDATKTGRSQIADFFGIFLGLPNAARHAALAGRSVQVRYADLTPNAQALVYRWMSGHSSEREGRENEAFIGKRDYPKTTIEATPSGTPERPGLRLRLRDTQNTWLQVRDILNTPRWDRENGWDWSHHSRSYRERARGPKDREANPALQAKITLAGGGEAFTERVLEELSRASGRPVLGEYDPCYASPYERERSHRVTQSKGTVREVPLWKALDILCEKFDLDWDYRDGWILIRSPRTVLSWAGVVDLSPPAKRPDDARERGAGGARPGQ